MIFKYSLTKNRPPIPQEIKKRIIENRQDEKELAGERGTLTGTARQIILSQTQTFF